MRGTNGEVINGRKAVSITHRIPVLDVQRLRAFVDPLLESMQLGGAEQPKMTLAHRWVIIVCSVSYVIQMSFAPALDYLLTLLLP
jgi:hypothetical protein